MAGEVARHLHDLYRTEKKVDPLKLLSDCDPFKNLNLSSMSQKEEDVFGK